MYTGFCLDDIPLIQCIKKKKKKKKKKTKKKERRKHYNYSHGDMATTHNILLCSTYDVDTTVDADVILDLRHHAESEVRPHVPKEEIGKTVRVGVHLHIACHPCGTRRRCHPQVLRLGWWWGWGGNKVRCACNNSSNNSSGSSNKMQSYHFSYHSLTMRHVKL